jgi:peptidoglycan/xylan/chitin deacetylase (PgdA/CDA1 family)
VRRIWPFTAGFACAACAAALLPPSARIAAWSALALAYLGMCALGMTSLRSGIFVRALTHGCADSSDVALTYDDGPDPASTPALLDLLRARNVRATFFVIGQKARAHGGMVTRCHAEGHLVALHSDRHSTWTNFLGRRALSRELNACRDTLKTLTGTFAAYYRPPFGLVNPEVDGVMRRLGLTLVGWRIRSLDTTARTSANVVARVLARIRGGDIVLLHDGGLAPSRVCEITASILDGLEKRGLAAVRLDRMHEPAPEP